MEDKRRHKRFRLDVLQVNGRLTFASEVTLLDMSLGGVSLEADHRLNMRGKYVIRLEERGKPLSVKGVVIWSRLSGARSGLEGEVVPLYTAGMKFIELSEEKVDRLLSFIEQDSTVATPPRE